MSKNKYQEIDPYVVNQVLIPRTQDGDSCSQWSVMQFIRYRLELIKDRREQMKKDILTYNFDDVMATRKLEEWLRSY